VAKDETQDSEGGIGDGRARGRRGRGRAGRDADDSDTPAVAAAQSARAGQAGKVGLAPRNAFASFGDPLGDDDAGGNRGRSAAPDLLQAFSGLTVSDALQDAGIWPAPMYVKGTAAADLCVRPLLTLARACRVLACIADSRAQEGASGREGAACKGDAFSKAKPVRKCHPRVEELLQACGLEEWVECFGRERIDYEALVELDTSDLVDLGMPLGHRKLLLKQLRLAAASDQDAAAASEKDDQNAASHPSPSSPLSPSQSPAPTPPPAGLKTRQKKETKKAARQARAAAAAAEEVHKVEADHTQDATQEDAHDDARPGSPPRPSAPDADACQGQGQGRHQVQRHQVQPEVEAAAEAGEAGEAARAETAEEEEGREGAQDGASAGKGKGKGKQSLEERRAAKKAAKLALRSAAADTQTAQGPPPGAAALEAASALDSFSVRQVSFARRVCSACGADDLCCAATCTACSHLCRRLLAARRLTAIARLHPGRKQLASSCPCARGRVQSALTPARAAHALSMCLVCGCMGGIRQEETCAAGAPTVCPKT